MFRRGSFLRFGSLGTRVLSRYLMVEKLVHYSVVMVAEGCWFGDSGPWETVQEVTECRKTEPRSR